MGPLIISFLKERTEIEGEEQHYRTILRMRDVRVDPRLPLWRASSPDVDLIITTKGEKRTLVPAGPIEVKFEQLAGVKQTAEVGLAMTLNPCARVTVKHIRMVSPIAFFLPACAGLHQSCPGCREAATKPSTPTPPSSTEL